MIEARQPEEEGLITYSRLYHLAPNRSPNLHALEQLVPGQSPVLSLSADEQATVSEQLASLRELCKGFGWTPIIIELALISDTRHRSPEPKPHFTSFIRLALPGARSVADVYLAAVRFMKGHEAAGVQIVPHPTLFNENTGYVSVKCEALAPPADEAEAPAVAAAGETFITATRENFVLLRRETIEASGRDLVRQVRLFAGRFMQLLHEQRELRPAFDVLRHTTLMVLPLLRPHRTSDVAIDSVGDAADLRGSPGGALFMFLQEDENPRRLTELGRAVSWLFVEAGMRESYTTLDLELEEKRALEQYRELLKVFGHGVANLMKAAGLVSLRERSLKLESLPSSEVKNALDLLWPVWGIADLSRIATMPSGELRDEWLTPRARKYVGDDGYLDADVTSVMPPREVLLARARSLVLAFVGALCTPGKRASAPLVKWCGVVVEPSDVFASCARALWPFEEDEYLSGTTLVTLGLFELLSNAVSYLRDAGLTGGDRWLDISGSVDENDTLLLTVEQAVIEGDWVRYRRSPTRGPRSSTIDKIRGTVESKLCSERGPIVVTDAFIASETELTVRARWAFAWRNARWQRREPVPRRIAGLTAR